MFEHTQKLINLFSTCSSIQNIHSLQIVSEFVMFCVKTFYKLMSQWSKSLVPPFCTLLTAYFAALTSSSTLDWRHSLYWELDLNLLHHSSIRLLTAGLWCLGCDLNRHHQSPSTRKILWTCCATIRTDWNVFFLEATARKANCAYYSTHGKQPISTLAGNN